MAQFSTMRNSVLLAALALNQVLALPVNNTMAAIYNSFPQGLSEVDVIIVGGGTTGCVVAAKISDAHPDLSVLIVEKGQDNYQDPTVTNPLFFMQNILDTGVPNPRMMAYTGTEPEPAAGNRVMSVPAGSILGGGSSINMLTYTRGQREDLEWGMPGWSADELLPYMNKLETYHGPGDRGDHGQCGPVQVSDGGFGVLDFQDDFIKAAAKVGIRESVDLQTLDDNNAVQRNLRYISPDGVRSDAAHAYLHPRLRDGEHPNLQVLVEHDVLRVLTEGSKAVGVEIRPNPFFKGESSTTYTVKAKRMVVVSAGNMGTPLVLERSGVGKPEVLAAAGVDVVAEVPGVGEDLQDHNTILLSYYTSQLANETYDVLLNGDTTFDSMIAEQNPMLAWNSAEITSKIRPTEEEIEALGMSDAALAIWDRDFRRVPNKPVATISTAGGFIAQIPEAIRDTKFLSTGNFLLHPYARGHIHITGPSIDDNIDLFTGILTDEAGFDHAMTMWLYKKTREVVRRLSVYRGEFPGLHPPFAADSAAALRTYDAPLPADVEDIQYTAEDDAVLSEWVKVALSQNWHSLGACKMAPFEEGGVVDYKLSVYGVENLKIADNSIVPINQAANTANIAFTVGEKGGAMIARELKCKK